MKKIFTSFYMPALIISLFLLLQSDSIAQSNTKSTGVTELKDCPECPQLVVIRPGSFTMGSPETEEGHEAGEIQHRVTISKAFALGKNPALAIKTSFFN